MRRCQELLSPQNQRSNGRTGHLLLKGYEEHPARIDQTGYQTAGRDRVRPVVMTALTTIAGLLPMALFKGAQDEIQYDTLATAVIGGLVASTIVTLLFVPVLFSLLVDLGRTLRRVPRTIARVFRTA